MYSLWFMGKLLTVRSHTNCQLAGFFTFSCKLTIEVVYGTSSSDAPYFIEQWFYIPGQSFINGGFHQYIVSIPFQSFVWYVPNLYLIYSYSGSSGFGGFSGLNPNHVFYLPAQIMIFSWQSRLNIGLPWFYFSLSATGPLMDADLVN